MLPRTASRLSTILFAISTLIYVNACGDSSTPITGGLGTGGTGGVAAVQVVDEIVAQGLTNPWAAKEPLCPLRPLR